MMVVDAMEERVEDDKRTKERMDPLTAGMDHGDERVAARTMRTTKSMVDIVNSVVERTVIAILAHEEEEETVIVTIDDNERTDTADVTADVEEDAMVRASGIANVEVRTLHPEIDGVIFHLSGGCLLQGCGLPTDTLLPTAERSLVPHITTPWGILIPMHTTLIVPE